MRSLLVLICIGLLGCGTDDFTPTPTITPTVTPSPTEVPVSCKLSLWSDLQRGDISYTIREPGGQVLSYEPEQNLESKDDLTLLVNLTLNYNYFFIDWTYLDVYSGDSLWSGSEYIQCSEQIGRADTLTVILPYEYTAW